MTRDTLLISLGLLLPALILSIGGGGIGVLHDTAAQRPASTTTADATQPGPVIEPGLWGSNLTNLTPAAQTVKDPAFVMATRQIGVTVIRWPGSNNASACDWKRNEMIKPGRRVPQPHGVDLARVLRFVRDTGAELSVTVNFGTMSAQDAADLVEFLSWTMENPVKDFFGGDEERRGFYDNTSSQAYGPVGTKVDCSRWQCT